MWKYLTRHYYDNGQIYIIVRYTQQLSSLILFIHHLPKNPLGSFILILESKISGFICVLVESKCILTCSFQREIHLNCLESFILCSH